MTPYAQNTATASKFRKLLSVRLDSCNSDIENSNEIRTNDLHHLTIFTNGIFSKSVLKLITNWYI